MPWPRLFQYAAVKKPVFLPWTWIVITRQPSKLPPICNWWKSCGRELPVLVQQLGGGSIFCQYRQVEASGIQFWATLGRMFDTRWLHATAREFLTGLDADLDHRLREVGLPGLGQIEVKPSQTQMVSMPGCYGKTVFIDRELKLIDGWSDVVSLNDYIQAHGPTRQCVPQVQGPDGSHL